MVSLEIHKGHSDRNASYYIGVCPNTPLGIFILLKTISVEVLKERFRHDTRSDEPRRGFQPKHRVAIVVVVDIA